MVQFKSNSTLQKHMKTKLSMKDNQDGSNLDKYPQSPTYDKQKGTERTKLAPLVYTYQQYQSQSNSECPGRKTKQRVKLEENNKQKKIQKSTLKRSFEDGGGSPLSSKNGHPVIGYKDIFQDKYNKPQRPSLGYGSSPQASSTSSKYCFSNRSSNISTKQQTLPESIHHKTFNLQVSQKSFQQQQNQANQQTKNQKVQNLSKKNLLANQSHHQQQSNPQVQQKPSLTLSMNNPRGASPHDKNQSILALTIAEEKISAHQKQAIIETPKFNEYYSLLGKHQIKIQNNIRSKSLVKSQILVPNSSGKLNHKEDLQNSGQQYQKDQQKIMKQYQERFLLQSHSSCSQNEDMLILQQAMTQQQSSDKSLEFLKQKRVKVIKLKKSDIKFQEKLNNQNPHKSHKIENIEYLAQFRSSHEVRKDKRKELNGQLSIDINAITLSGGVMIGSPKIYQKQQQAKDEVESSVISSQSSIQSEQEDQKVSQLKIEKKINSLPMNKEEIINYKLFLDNDCIDSKHQQKQRKAKVRNSRKKSDALQQSTQGLENLYSAKITKRQNIPQAQVHLMVKSKKHNGILKNEHTGLGNKSQNVNIQFQEGVSLSGSSTYREFPVAINQAQTRLQDDSQRSNQKIIHFSNAKQEFMQISAAKSHRQRYNQKYINENDNQQILDEGNNDTNHSCEQEEQPNSLQIMGGLTIESFDKSGNLRFNEKPRKRNNIQQSIPALRNSIKSMIAVEASLGQYNKLNNNQIQSKQLVFKIIENGKILELLLQHLSMEEMC